MKACFLFSVRSLIRSEDGCCFVRVLAVIIVIEILVRKDMDMSRI